MTSIAGLRIETAEADDVLHDSLLVIGDAIDSMRQ